MAAASTTSPHLLNTVGTVCPLPVLLAVAEMRHLGRGELLEILGDDPGILEDIPAWCELNGHRLVEMSDEEGLIVCLVEKGARSEAPVAPPEDPGEDSPGGLRGGSAGR